MNYTGLINTEGSMKQRSKQNYTTKLSQGLLSKYKSREMHYTATMKKKALNTTYIQLLTIRRDSMIYMNKQTLTSRAISFSSCSYQVAILVASHSRQTMFHRRISDAIRFS